MMTVTILTNVQGSFWVCRQIYFMQVSNWVTFIWEIKKKSFMYFDSGRTELLVSGFWSSSGSSRYSSILLQHACGCICLAGDCCLSLWIQSGSLIFYFHLLEKQSSLLRFDSFEILLFCFFPSCLLCLVYFSDGLTCLTWLLASGFVTTCVFFASLCMYVQPGRSLCLPQFVCLCFLYCNVTFIHTCCIPVCFFLHYTT